MTELFTFKKRTLTFLLSFVALSVWLILSASHDQRQILLPVLTAVAVTGLLIYRIWNRTRVAPLFDIGCITALATLCYTIIPPIQYLLSGMQHTPLSAIQLYVLDPSPEELGALTWLYAVYLLSFVIGYLVFDSKGKTGMNKPMPPDRNTVRSLILLFIVFSIFTYAVYLLYGINQYVIYGTEEMQSSYETLLQMPLFFRQLYGMLTGNGLFFIVKLGLLLAIFLNWNKQTYRYALYAWLFFMLVSNVLWMGARTELVLTLLSSVIMYHRFVKPLKFTLIMSAGVILFAGFTIIGMIRGTAESLSNLRTILDNTELIFTMSSEFQTLFGGNFDLLLMKQGGRLGEVPLQFIFYDLIMIIPQQILPFEKLDVQQWVTNLSNNPGYFMLNPISQSIIGFGWVELILRGLFLGLVFAKVSAWYIGRASSYWITLFYVYLIIISYNTIRSTAIYVMLASTLFRFIPLYFLVRFLVTRRKRAQKRVSASSKIVNA